MDFCYNCGYTLQPNSNFCPRCGVRVYRAHHTEKPEIIYIREGPTSDSEGETGNKRSVESILAGKQSSD